MTTFPALIPSSRTFTPGEYPHTSFAGWSGRPTRVRHSNVMLASTLSVSFIGLPAADVEDIVDHYGNQLGTFTPFGLPTELWSGVADPADYTLTGYLWRYAEPPSIEDLPCGGHNVELVLESVPPEGATIAGLNRRITFAFTSGVAGATAGINATITLSMLPGAATSFAPGLDESITLSLAAGTASTNGGPLGSILWSLTPGEAEGTGAIDPDFASVALLLHCDGTNDSTTFTDSSSNTLSGTVEGSAKLSTAEKKFGTASANFNSGTNACIKYTDNALDVATSEDFTWEFWAYVTEVTTTTIFGSVNYIVESQGSNDLAISLKEGTGGDKFWAFAYDNSTGWDHQDTVTLNQWQHVALVRDSDVINLYVDGVKSSSSTTLDYALDNAAFFSVGPRSSGDSNKLYIDEARITIGVARYTATFTPPTAAFPDS
jgi:hypothetical protein